MNLETLQIVIVAALSISTILVVIIALQLIFLLKDIRKIVHRVERITVGFGMISNFIEHSLGEVESITDVGKGLLKIIAKFTERKVV